MIFFFLKENLQFRVAPGSPGGVRNWLPTPRIASSSPSQLWLSGQSRHAFSAALLQSDFTYFFCSFQGCPWLMGRRGIGWKLALGACIMGPTRNGACLSCKVSPSVKSSQFLLSLFGSKAMATGSAFRIRQMTWPRPCRDGATRGGPPASPPGHHRPRLAHHRDSQRPLQAQLDRPGDTTFSFDSQYRFVKCRQFSLG